MRKRQRKKNYKKKIVIFDQIPMSFLVSILKKKYGSVQKWYKDVTLFNQLPVSEQQNGVSISIPYFKAFDVQNSFKTTNKKDISIQ